ncbi:uncharacterized protein LOC108872377 [Brassica rapa]|uniref:uncharacterized protein LOC108872377 n=1 Tax=Brassica campestris TaxID=3711 RepID=UPI000873014A|nr:uncharacterized protein LOC108872377 [Brassica rapa]
MKSTQAKEEKTQLMLSLSEEAPFLIKTKTTTKFKFQRNRFVFNGASASPEDTLATAIRAAKEWEQGSLLLRQRHRRLKRAPLLPSFALMQPGGKEDKKAGLGWTVKTERFEIRRKKPHGHVSSPLVAEGLAIREALLFCREHSLNDILLESDSAQLIKAINQKECIAEVHGILSDILHLSGLPDVSILFSWIPRDKNLVADSLSKEALCMVEGVIAPT